MHILTITDTTTEEIIFTGSADEFLEVNNYDLELEELLNTIEVSNRTSHNIYYNDNHYHVEKEVEEIY